MATPRGFPRIRRDFDNLQRVRRSALTERIGDLGTRRGQICTALALSRIADMATQEIEPFVLDVPDGSSTTFAAG